LGVTPDPTISIAQLAFFSELFWVLILGVDHASQIPSCRVHFEEW